jgi:hypothetical protein
MNNALSSHGFIKPRTPTFFSHWPLGWALLASLFLSLLACGGTRPESSPGDLATALSQGNKAIIQQHLSTHRLSANAGKLAEMRLMQIENRPLPLAALSQSMAKNLSDLTPAQLEILKSLALWAHAQPIYRQELGGKVRILQREKLYLAPSHIDLAHCAAAAPGCANTLRQHLARLVTPEELNQALMEMARRDPCINLTDQLQSDKKAHRCLSKQMGELEVELLPPARFSPSQWRDALRQ